MVSRTRILLLSLLDNVLPISLDYSLYCYLFGARHRVYGYLQSCTISHAQALEKLLQIPVTLINAIIMERTTLALIIGISLFSSCYTSTVPVIAWSNTGNLFSTRQISAGEEISPESLSNDFLDVGLGDGHQTIVLVLLNKLSMGDVTRYGNAYDADTKGGVIPHIKNSMETAASSLVLPQADTSSLVDDLMSKVTARGGEVTEISNPTDLAAFKADPSKTNLLIIRVEPSDSMEQQLAGADRYVKIAMSLFQDKATDAPFTVLFSSAKTSKLSSHSSGRRLLQSAEDSSSNFTFINYTSDGCMAFLYAGEITAKLVENGKTVESFVLPKNGWGDYESKCISNDSLDLGIKISDLKNGTQPAWLTSVSVLMKFTTVKGFWSSNSTTITYQLKDDDTGKDVDVQLPSNLETPRDWSYHCGDIDFTSKNSTFVLYFYDLQIQPFDIKDNEFSSANDCIGYFTPAIWMGIITSLMIVSIVAFGISMMAAVRVMDKFDDPKGKQLVINVPES